MKYLILLITLFGIFPVIAQNDYESLKRQLEQQERELKNEINSSGGLSYEELQELTLLCAKRHPGQFEEIGNCVSIAKENAENDLNRNSSRTNNYSKNSRTANQNTNSQNNKLSQNDWTDMLYTPNHKACIEYKTLETKLKTSTENHCPRKNEYGSCRDIEFNKEIRNVCDSNLWVRWKFSPSKYENWGQVELRPGQTKLIHCKQSFDQCTGASVHQVRSSR